MDNKPKNQQLAQKKDFSIPQRMSKSAFVVILYNEIKRYVSFYFIIIILNLFNSEKQVSFLETIGKLFLILGGLLLLSFVMAFLQYYYKQFYVNNGNLIFIQGIFRRETTSIPVYKIHSTRTKRGIIYRLLDMKGVSFDTLASKTEEIELILDDADWKDILLLVERQEQGKQSYKGSGEFDENYKPAENQSELKDVEQMKFDCATETEEQTVTSCYELRHNPSDCSRTLKFSNLNLVKGAFCQNHLKGMAILGSAMFALYGQVSQICDKAVLYAFDYLEAYSSKVSFTFSIFIITLIAFYVIVMMLWIGKVFLRYFNMEVHMNHTLLFFESGLLTRLSSQFAYDKVCTVYVKQNLLEKWMGCCTLNLKQAFNATDNKNESDVKIYGSNSANHFLNWWLGKDFSTSKEILSAHSGYGLLGYTIRFDIVIILTSLITLVYFGEFIWMIIPSIYMLICLAKGICAVSHSAITLREDYFIVNNGKFADVRNYIKYSNIEVVRLIRTPFTSYFHRVNLVLSTNGTSFLIRSLKEEEAQYIYELLIAFCRNEEVSDTY